MNQIIYGLIATLLGIALGSLRGLSLIKRGEALSHSFISPLIHTAASMAIGLYLLHWGTIPFILFGGTLILTMWIVIITHNS